jgi:hypothetical protein
MASVDPWAFLETDSGLPLVNPILSFATNLRRAVISRALEQPEAFVHDVRATFATLR